MRRLSEQELDIKIARFLNERLARYPELEDIKESDLQKSSKDLFVSRVKNISKRFDGAQLNQPMKTHR